MFLVKYYGYDDKLIDVSFVYGIGTNEARLRADLKSPKGALYFMLEEVLKD